MNRAKLVKSVLALLLLGNTAIAATNVCAAEDNSFPQAVCDTDFNCEVLYELYKDYNIDNIFVADDKWQNSSGSVVQVTCSDGRISYANADIPEELKFTCENPKKSIQEAKEEAKTSKLKKTAELTLDWKEIDEVINSEPHNRLQNKGDSAPSLVEFRDFIRTHPEAEAVGTYYNDSGLLIDEIWVRFGSKEYVDQWFLDFCENSDENPTNNPTTIPGWRCWWD